MAFQALADRGVRALHDRRIPRSRANVDHIAISSAGVFVIDTKRYKGRPSLRVEGGILRPRTETLMVGSRRSNNLIDGMHKQLAMVQGVIGHEVPITGTLVFLEADWPLVGGAFATQQVKVVWPKKAAEAISQPGPLEASKIEALHRALAGFSGLYEQPRVLCEAGVSHGIAEEVTWRRQKSCGHLCGHFCL